MATLEKIDSIRYSAPKVSVEDCEKLWADDGYIKITNNFWRLEKKPRCSYDSKRT